MADNKKFIYKPKNPYDPKMPNLLDDWDPHYYTEEEIRYKQKQRAKFAFTEEEKNSLKELEATEEIIIQKAKKENKFKKPDPKTPFLSNDNSKVQEKIKKEAKKLAQDTLKKAKLIEEAARKKEAESKRILKLAEEKLREEKRLARQIELSKRPKLRTKDFTDNFTSDFTNVETKVKVKKSPKKFTQNLDEDFTSQYTKVDTIVKVDSKKKNSKKNELVSEANKPKQVKPKQVKKQKTFNKPNPQNQKFDSFWFDDSEDLMTQEQINELKKFTYKPKNPNDPKMPNLRDGWNPTVYDKEKTAYVEYEAEDSISLNHEPTSLDTQEDTNSTKELVFEFEPIMKPINEQEEEEREAENRFITDVYSVIPNEIPDLQDNSKSKKPSLNKYLELNIIDENSIDQAKFSLNNIPTVDDEFSDIYAGELSDEEIEMAKKASLESSNQQNQNDDNLVEPTLNSTEQVRTGELLASSRHKNNKVFEMLQSVQNEEEVNSASSDVVYPTKTSTKAFENVTNYKNDATKTLINNEESNKENSSRNLNSNGFLMPDPNYKYKISSYRDLYSINSGPTTAIRRRPHAIGAINSEIKKPGNDVRRELNESEIKTIKDAFKEKVIKITSKEVLIKEKKYGYEIYFNLNDQRWWTVAQTFPEPYIATTFKQIVHSTLWSGTSFIGHGANTLKETIENTRKMFVSGRTGNVVIKEYLVDYDTKSKRIYTSNFPVSLTFEQYKKFASWYKSNKIEIFLKTYGKKDAEDLEKEAYENKKRGIKDMGSVLGGKLADAPRRANHIFAYPVLSPKGSKANLERPENKMYQVAFGVTD